MDKNKKCSACNKNLDKDNDKNNRTNCKNCYNEKKIKSNIYNTFIQGQQPENDNVKTNNNNPTILVGTFFRVKHILCCKNFHEYHLVEIFIKSPKSSPE